MRRWYEIFKGPETVENRRTAIELLRVGGGSQSITLDPRVLRGRRRFQAWGAGVLDQLLWSEWVEQEEAEELLRTAEQHSNQSVRECAEFVRGYLRSRAEASKERRDDDGCCGE